MTDNACEFCENRTKVIDILGKPVRVKNYICSPDGIHYRPKPENVQLQLSVCPVSYCPANCRFCCAKGTKTERRIDTKRFAEVMCRLKEGDHVRGVKITGGEPFTDVGLLNEVISILFEIFGYDLELAVSTNAIGLKRVFEIKDLVHLESIHISRHHYDDAVNRKLFGNEDIPGTDELKEIVNAVSYKDLWVFNTMFLKDAINSPEEAHRFLEYAIKVGVPKVGFMVCSPATPYAAEQTIPYESVIRKGDPSLLFTRSFYDYEFCHCSDGVFVSENGEIIQFYGRSTKMCDYGYSRGLVYDSDNHLRDGFGGEIIV
ncbi:MAG: radical SAM protein [Lachnospiraceae bacterium]|nr:radical SAM protein [Lachnospiraceae bacterium]